jgi:hypothetical protein
MQYFLSRDLRVITDQYFISVSQGFDQLEGLVKKWDGLVEPSTVA